MTWTWGLGQRPTIILGLTHTTDLTGSTLAAAVSYGFTPFQILAPPRNSSPSLLPACIARRDSSPPTPAFRDPVRERGDQVFGELTRATAGSDDFANDDFFPDLGNLVLDDMGDNVNAGGAAPAAPYVILSFLFEIVVEFMLLVCALDVICSSTMLVRMISLIPTAVVMIYLLFIRIKSRSNLLIFPTIQKPDYRQFTPSGFAAHLKPPAFKEAQYKRWRTRAVY